ncbi:MAG: hypothetical protein NE330_23865 [Lentisphaeraceae bacterium]|nr:hypothetical protein [Lentisphaeraceae bacterium]
MALIVEDGSIVADANSFIDVTYARNYADLRGLSLPTDDADIEKLLVKAADKINSSESRFKGLRVSSSQSLSFPRYPLNINGFDVSSSVIHKDVKDAQAQLAIDAQTFDLMPNNDGKELKSKGTGPLKKEWFEKGTSVSEPELTAANSLLEKFYSSGSGGGLLDVCR